MWYTNLGMVFLLKYMPELSNKVIKNDHMWCHYCVEFLSVAQIIWWNLQMYYLKNWNKTIYYIFHKVIYEKKLAM